MNSWEFCQHVMLNGRCLQCSQLNVLTCLLYIHKPCDSAISDNIVNLDLCFGHPCTLLSHVALGEWLCTYKVRFMRFICSMKLYIHHKVAVPCFFFKNQHTSFLKDTNKVILCWHKLVLWASLTTAWIGPSTHFAHCNLPGWAVY